MKKIEDRIRKSFDFPLSLWVRGAKLKEKYAKENPEIRSDSSFTLLAYQKGLDAIEAELKENNNG